MSWWRFVPVQTNPRLRLRKQCTIHTCRCIFIVKLIVWKENQKLRTRPIIWIVKARITQNVKHFLWNHKVCLAWDILPCDLRDYGSGETCGVVEWTRVNRGVSDDMDRRWPDKQPDNRSVLCPAKTNSSDCSLEKWAVTAVCLCIACCSHELSFPRVNTDQPC